MPTYEYECDACGLRFERRQHMTDAPVEACPECGGEVRRLVSGGSGFILKGTGWTNHVSPSACSSLQKTGRTCCGRDERCDKPACGGKD